MNASAANQAPPSAAAEYRRRLANLSDLQLRDRRRGRDLGVAKLIVVVLAIASAVLLLRHFPFVLLTAALVLVFIVLAVRHEKLLQAIRIRARIVDFYERGLARLEGRWAGKGETGDQFLDSAHPYARDLDIFGNASLFQYLCVARTRAGEEMLAKWLLEPASTQEISARQAAVVELQSRMDFREAIASAGEAVRATVHPDDLVRWGEASPLLTSTATRILTSVLALFWLLSIAAWAAWGVPQWLVLMTVLNFAYAHRIHARLERAAATIEKSEAELRRLAEVLARVERERFQDARLAGLQNAIMLHGIAPSLAVRRLARIVDLLQSRHSLFARPLDLVLFWSAQLTFMAERWQRKYGASIRTWIAAVAELEALSSLATFAYEHPSYAMPQVALGPPCFQATGLAHPLLPLADAVVNDIAFGAGRQVMILSGPNMAGKSTFIRSIGVNAVLAQCGAPVRALSLRMSPFRVAASICILDSLSGGISRFYAEIRRVKLIADLADGSLPVLFLLDELLSGTNSHDRLIGTQFVLKSLAARNAIGIVSTHDLALTRIVEDMSSRAFNAHFEDRLEGDRLIFDYKLKPGVVQTSNALHLMRAIGLGVDAPRQTLDKD